MPSREERIQQIKECGQSIIDNAEKIFGDYPYSTGDLILNITFNRDYAPIIKVDRMFYPEKYIERITTK